MPGKYVVFARQHFRGLEIWQDGTFILRPTCRTHIGSISHWRPGLQEQFEAVFHLVPTSHCDAGSDSIDVCGGGEDAGVLTPILQKEPSVWLNICHNRANALRKRWGAATTDPKEEDELRQSGLSREQAQFYVASYAAAKQRQHWMRSWDTAMPPMLRQTFGIQHSQRRGIRIPLPPLDAQIPSLPAVWGSDDLPCSAFDWLERQHPHPRDKHIRFEPDGHKYFVRDDAVDMSVTSLISSFAQDCAVALLNFAMSI